MIIRLSLKEDKEALIQIFKRIKGINDYQKEIEFYFNNQALFSLVDDDSVIGLCCLSYEIDCVEIDYFAIDSKYEGKGVASFFLNEICSLLFNQSKTILLEVRSDNDKAISLYERNGFKRYRVRKNYYVDNLSDAYCYKREKKDER